MNKLGKYIANVVGGSLLLVLFLVVGLDVISAIIDQLGDLRRDYTFVQAVYYVLLTVPGRIHEYIPLSALIGCLVGMGLLAGNSELTVMRASGISLLKLVTYAIRPVLGIMVISFLISEYISPVTDEWAKTHKDLKLWGASHSLVSSQAGLWHREGDTFMHFNVVQSGGVLLGVTLFQFDQNRLKVAQAARRASFQNNRWLLEDVSETAFVPGSIVTRRYKTLPWDTGLEPSSLAFLANEPSALAPTDLYQYSNYLDQQGLDSAPYRLALWQKCLQPLVIFSLVLIALSFVFGPLRSATMGFRVFIGVVIGIAFQFAQNLLGPASLIYGFPPVIAVLLPVLLCTMIGLVLLHEAR